MISFKEVMTLNFFLSVLAIYIVFTTEAFKMTQKVFKMLKVKLIENGAITKVGLMVHSVVAYILVTKVVPRIVRSLNAMNK